MFKKTKFKSASKRVNHRAPRRTTKKRTSFWARAKKIIAAPFRAFGRAMQRIWKWIKSINVIGLINSTLLVAIIVLFSMLIIDFLHCNKKPVVIVANDTPVVATPIQVTEQKSEKQTPTLPLKRGIYVTETIEVVQIKADPVACGQIARQNKKLHGDIVIDSRGAATVLHAGDVVNGNLYLQNMRKYTLPCGVKINGNLFLRDMNMLNFCGEFTVNGNIYVSPRSSFGPIPRNARIRGHVIL